MRLTRHKILVSQLLSDTCVVVSEVCPLAHYILDTCGEYFPVILREFSMRLYHILVGAEWGKNSDF